jgi:hypothetical protein
MNIGTIILKFTKLLKLTFFQKASVLGTRYLRLPRFGRVEISSVWSTPPPRAW